MDFLSGYDSHSDSDEEIKAVSQDQLVNVQTKNVSYSKPITSIQPEKKAKKKKFNISILPTEIQHALTQADYLLDSDEETDNMKINSHKKQAELSSSSILPPSASDSTTMKGLMRLLPKPSVAAASDDYFTVAKKALVLKPISASTSSSASIKTVNITQEKPKSTFSFAITTTTTSITNPAAGNKVKVNSLVPTASSNVKTESTVDSDEDDYDNYHVAKPRDLSSSTFSSSSSSSSSMFTFANKTSSSPAPPASSIGTNYYDTSNYSHPTSVYGDVDADSLNVSYPQPQPQGLPETCSSNSYDTLYAPQGQNYPSTYDDHQHNPNNYYHSVQGYAEVQDSSNSYRTDTVSNNATTATNKRRRDREIEQAFLSGQISDVSDVAEKFGININQTKCIDGVGKEWDSSKYNEQKRLQAEVQHAFHLSGDAIASGGAGQPSKQQTRKHQINSLAFQAAKTQLALLETKGARMKTKHETQSKYGW